MKAPVNHTNTIVFFNLLTVLILLGVFIVLIPINNLSGWTVNTTKGSYVPGDIITYNSSFHKRFDAVPSSSRNLQCTGTGDTSNTAVEIPLAGNATSHPVGSHTITSYDIVPVIFPTGVFQCRMHTHVHYTLFGIKPTDQDNYSNVFTVTSKGVN